MSDTINVVDTEEYKAKADWIFSNSVLLLTVEGSPGEVEIRTTADFLNQAAAKLEAEDGPYFNVVIDLTKLRPPKFLSLKTYVELSKWLYSPKMGYLVLCGDHLFALTAFKVLKRTIDAFRREEIKIQTFPDLRAGIVFLYNQALSDVQSKAAVKLKFPDFV